MCYLKNGSMELKFVTPGAKKSISRNWERCLFFVPMFNKFRRRNVKLGIEQKWLELRFYRRNVHHKLSIKDHTHEVWMMHTTAADCCNAKIRIFSNFSHHTTFHCRRMHQTQLVWMSLNPISVTWWWNKSLPIFPNFAQTVFP